MIVIDVCEYQRNLNLDVIPFEGLIARVTKRNNKLDPAFYDYMRLENSKKLGAYKYSYAHNHNDAALEAVEVARTIRGIKLDLGFWLDLETDYLRAASDNLILEIIQEYERVLNNYDLKLSGIYCDFDFYKTHENVLKDFKIWAARWKYDAKTQKELSYRIPRLAAWQYTNKYKGLDLDASDWYTSVDINEVLKYNLDNVRKVQEHLNTKYNSGLVVDGVMGSKTFTAIWNHIK